MLILTCKTNSIMLS